MDYVTRQFIVLAKKLRDEFRQTRESLIAELKQLRKVIEKNNDPAANKEKGANHENPPRELVSPLRVSAEVSITNAPVGDTPAEKERNYRVQNSIKHAAWFAGVAAAVYGGIAILQWCEMRKTTKAAVSSAEAARKQIVIDQRAWLKFSNDPKTPFMKGQPIGIHVQITNIGKTPAEHLWWAIYTDIVPMGTEPDLPASHIVPEDKAYKLDRSDVRKVDIPHQQFERSLLYPTDHDDGTATRLKRVFESGTYRIRPEPFVSPEWEQFAQGKSYIVVFGEVWYLDVFGLTHWTSFCISKSISGGNTSRKCADYGKVDNNTE